VTTTQDAMKTANIGIQINLKSFDDPLTVRELSLESILKLSNELVSLLETLNTDGDKFGEDADSITVLLKIVQDPATLRALQLIAAASTSEKSANFEDLPISDWLKWATAFKEVSGWEELRQLFFQLVPQGAAGLGQLKSPTGSPSSSTGSLPSTDGLKKRS